MFKHLEFRILIDNSSQQDLLTEHGFAVWVECDDKVILFDTGQNGILSDNARAMGCDLKRVDTLVLSHGHYDHTGAISQLLEANPSVRVICHPRALTEKRYSIYPGKDPRMIAMPEIQRQALEALPEQQLTLISGYTYLYPGVGFSGEIPRNHPLEDTGGPFFLNQSAGKADLIDDDISLWFNTDRGLVILTGCCHSGLINTVRHIQNITGEKRIAGIIGGLHLNRASQERLQVTRDALLDWQPEFIIPCHCTGEEATELLKTSLGDRVRDGGSGLVKKLY